MSEFLKGGLLEGLKELKELAADERQVLALANGGIKSTIELVQLLSKMAPSREVSLAITKLQEAEMWLNRSK